MWMATFIFDALLTLEIVFASLKEHWNLTWERVRDDGVYEDDGSSLAGLPYLEILEMVDKKNKLSVSRDNLFKTGGGTGGLRVAHNPNDELSVYTLWGRLKGMKHPNQKFVYHYEASAAVREMWEAEGKGNCRMNPLRRMGRNKVGNLLQDLCTKLQIPGSENLRNHCLRQAGITKMVNDPSINQLEVLHAARHHTSAAQLPYVRSTGRSASNLQAAIACCPFPASTKKSEPSIKKPAAKRKTPTVKRSKRLAAKRSRRKHE
jgi:hypothetical protein